MTIILSAHDLVKAYPDVIAVDGIGFQVESGSCYGLLGPNGAGKTTTMELLEGIIQPDRGQILYQGKPIDSRFRHEIGIQFQSTSLLDFQTVQEALVMFAALYEKTADLAALIELCHLQEFIERDTRKLSGGQRQRLLLAIALVNDPHLVFLDEPTTGLDPQSRRNFWALIEGIKQAGKTIILTTHYMEEAYRLCDQIAIVDKGRIIIEGRPDDLLQQHFASTVIRLPGSAIKPAQQLPDDIKLVDGQFEMFTDDVPKSIARLELLGVGLGDCQISAPSLEDLFLKLTGHALRT
ncbi:MAG: ABC transporter ATP-binding protein [Gammaproteobacteria bacterium]|nr:ABC transporter ATP-binding protein [Gammaproteobacteria bacterium]MBL7000231.1 ABC transporter ATP-binding protein [Gammaproteobacteria bacterium]